MSSEKSKQRIVAIDLLRGFALLGILLMNMSSFAMPGAPYSNPLAYGGQEWWNLAVFNLSYLFANQKMMALFSMLFGASVMLITNNMEQRGEKPLRYHYLRNLWLLLIGLAHSFQEVERLPSAPWDVRLDCIATENEFITTNR